MILLWLEDWLSSRFSVCFRSRGTINIVSKAKCLSEFIRKHHPEWFSTGTVKWLDITPSKDKLHHACEASNFFVILPTVKEKLFANHMQLYYKDIGFFRSVRRGGFLCSTRFFLNKYFLTRTGQMLLNINNLKVLFITSQSVIFCFNLDRFESFWKLTSSMFLTLLQFQFKSFWNG